MVSSTTCPGCSDALPATAHFCAQCGQPRDAILLSLPDDPPSVPRRASVRERLHDELLEKLRLATADEYEIVHELGRGGMATVFLALDLALGRKVAIKVMSPGLLYHDDDAVERFKREARTAAQLSHPQIIPIHAVKEAAGLLFFVMQFVEGESLEAVIKRSAPLPLAQVQSLLVQIGGALAYAHRRGVVHRDVKPANIMLDAEGWPVIMDFGIAKAGEGHSRLTQTGAPIGTPAFMSPEQCIATVVGGASDQYSLGV
ncbi:MAG: protein kinase, partial [Gemmatimonadaceae bacterium]|nr:protein kinase [Gemmatimonadaceae bacterium]